jgi:hypothetical protein
LFNRNVGLLVVRDFCFWAIWAAGSVHKKSWGRLWATFEGVFFMYSESNFSLNFFENTIASALKIWIINYYYVNLLHKGLLLQDWVFRLRFEKSLWKMDTSGFVHPWLFPRKLFSSMNFQEELCKCNILASHTLFWIL